MGVPQGALDAPRMHARCEQRGGVGMPPGMDGDAHCADPGPVFGGAEGALDTGAAHGRGRRWAVLVVSPGGGKAPGGMPRGFPGGAEQSAGLLGQGDVPVCGALAAVDMDLEARAINVGHWQEEGFLESEAQTLHGGEGDLVMQGSRGREEPSARLHTEDGGEPVGGVRAQERSGVPVALADVLREKADATGADTHGSRGESVNIFPVQEVVLEFGLGDHVWGFVGELGEQTDFADIGFLSPFACATELEGGDHLLTQRGHEISPFVS